MGKEAKKINLKTKDALNQAVWQDGVKKCRINGVNPANSVKGTKPDKNLNLKL